MQEQPSEKISIVDYYDRAFDRVLIDPLESDLLPRAKVPFSIDEERQRRAWRDLNERRRARLARLEAGLADEAAALARPLFQRYELTGLRAEAAAAVTVLVA